jgi:hypothetical protein
MDFVREILRLQLIGELPELVEIDTRPEPERMRNRLGRRMASDHGILPDPGTNCLVHGRLKGNTEFPCTLFQQSGKIVVERQSRPHTWHNDGSQFDVETSAGFSPLGNLDPEVRRDRNLAFHLTHRVLPYCANRGTTRARFLANAQTHRECPPLA